MWCFFSIWTIVLVFQQCSSVSETEFYSEQNNATYLNKSMVNLIDTSYETCCAGKILILDSEENFCCGTREYNIKTQMCCNGTVYDMEKSDFGKKECCGTELYSIDEGVCCYSHYTGLAHVEKFPDEIKADEEAKAGFKCCGLKPYNNQTHSCCVIERDEKLRELSFSDYDKKQMIYHSNYTEENEVLVNKLKYRELLFSKMVFKTPIYELRNANNGTCEESDFEIEPIDWKRLIFETMDDLNVPSIKGKCNEESFNMTTHICCPIHPIEGHDFKTESQLYPIETLTTACCGVLSYKFDREICCNNRKVHPQNAEGSMQCCGDEAYDASTQRCCLYSGSNVNITSLEDPNDSCCGESQTPFDSATQICCGDTVSPRESEDAECCWDAETKTGVVYNDDTEFCCKGAKYPQSSDSSCCGSEVIDKTKQICCRGTPHPKASPEDKCCGNNVYNTETHVCNEYDKSVVAKAKPTDTKCCGTTSYDKEKEICCATIKLSEIDDDFSGNVMEPLTASVFERKFEDTGCCGLDIYNKNESRCCNGKTCAKSEVKRKICGKAIYDPKEHLCCQPHLYTFDVKRTRKCCGRNAYYSDRQVCCGGIIVDTEFPEVAECCYKPDLKNLLINSV